VSWIKALQAKAWEAGAGRLTMDRPVGGLNRFGGAGLTVGLGVPHPA